MYQIVRANLHILFGVLSVFAVAIYPFSVNISSSLFITSDVTAMLHVAFFALGLYSIGLALDMIFIERSRLTVLITSLAIAMSSASTLLPSQEFFVSSLVIMGAHIILLFSYTLHSDSLGHIYRFFGAVVGVLAVALYHWEQVSQTVVFAGVMFTHATLLRVQLENKLDPVSEVQNTQRKSSVADASIYEDDQTQTAQNPTRVVNGLFQSYAVASQPPTIRDGFHRDRTSKRASQPDPNLKENPTLGDELGVVAVPIRTRPPVDSVTHQDNESWDEFLNGDLQKDVTDTGGIPSFKFGSPDGKF